MTQEELNATLNRALDAMRAQRYNESRGICEDVLAALPDNPHALAILGTMYAHIRDVPRGIEALEKAIAAVPGVADWCSNLSALYQMDFQYEKAVHWGKEAIRLNPNDSHHLVNLALIFADLDEWEASNTCLMRALGVDPQNAEAHLAMAENLLAAGEFEAGWREYEWRNQTKSGHPLPALTSAPWNGMRLPKGRLLIACDQGYGDSLQFARYIPMAAERCQEVILGAELALKPLLGNIPGVTHYCHRWTDAPPHAAYCRLSSLPYLFGTTLETIPADVPYLFADEPNNWHERLPKGFRVGLAWTGRPTHANDRRRSLALESLLPLVDTGAAFVSLQKPMPERDLGLLGRFGMTDLSADLTDFGATASLIENLDLVITVDTAVGHLAGALNVPTWIMIPKAADWRWMLNCTDSPWYPSVRLFRQKHPGEWAPVIQEVAAALRDKSATNNQQTPYHTRNEHAL